MKDIFKKESFSGFTLVEIMVVLAIVVVLAVLLLSGYSEGRPRLAVERTAEAFITDLYRARQRGFSGTIYKIGGVDLGVEGHGIEVVKGQEFYNIYVKDNSGRTSIQETRIEELVEISSIYVGTVSRNSIRIFFEAKGGIKVNGDPAQEVKIVFAAKKDNNIRATVIVSTDGVARIDYN